MRTAGASARIDASSLQRHPVAIEAALYFFCRAALEGAGEGAALTIDLQEKGDVLRLEIAGLDGTELLSARDLVEAAGGVVLVEVSPGTGARVVVTMPV